MTPYFVRNPISAWMLFLAVGMAGAIAMIRLPVSLTTESSIPALSVIMEYPGASPDKIESLIAIPAEKEVKTISGIQKIVSVCEEGKCRINIHFIPGTDMKTASLWVREKIGLIRHTFPRETQEPLVLRHNSNDRPVFIATIDKDGFSAGDIREIAEREIKPQIQRIEGVSEVAVAGGVLSEIHIDIDRGRLGSRNISLDHIARSVQRENISLPAGLMETTTGSYHVY
ncbi:MAG TPA: efflux RND transporter permease subunit, partial [Spirochaetes bacterium]|nr:efflux RND transporter permease subunit [Spirochaetota bacterium]